MALWVLGRPPEKCDPTERWVAHHLSQLTDDWVICWGYRYGANGNVTPDREGDFVVQGPSGHVCTIEVKSGRMRHYALSGCWEHADGDNPADQVHAQGRGMIALLADVAGDGSKVPYVHSALALPNVDFVEGDRFRGQLSRDRLLGKFDCQHFPGWWERHVACHPLWIGGAAARQVFLGSVAAAGAPRAMRHFIGETDAIINRQLETESAILDLVAGNRQLLVHGGCGSGKTFMAVEQARRWAERGDGERVLLLCYNLPLAEQLAEVFQRRPTPRGEVVVKSWEALAEDLLRIERIPLAAPAEPEAKKTYFTNEVPGMLAMLLDDGRLVPQFDALVVDEGQDHDTRLPDNLGRTDLAGWWSFYLRLLHQAEAAPIAVFYDPAQRPRFRDPAGFDVRVLGALFSQPAHLRLPRALRYTRPIHEYLVGSRQRWRSRTCSCSAPVLHCRKARRL
jgi:hypothetical protein